MLLRGSLCFITFWAVWLGFHSCDSFSIESPTSIWRKYILVGPNNEPISSCVELPPETDRPDEDDLEILYPTERRYFQFPTSSESDDDSSVDPTIMIRQTSFGCGKMGHQVWPSAIALSIYLCKHQHLTRNQNVMEIGAGCGLPSAVCRDVLGVSSILATDFWMLPTSEWEKDRLIPENWHGINLEFNILRGDENSKNAKVQQLDWHKPDSIREALQIGQPKLVIGSDLIYYTADIEPFWNTIEICLKEGGVDKVLLFSPWKPENRESLPDFRRLLETKGKEGYNIEIDEFTLHRDEIGNSVDLLFRMSIMISK